VNGDTPQQGTIHDAPDIADLEARRALTEHLQEALARPSTDPQSEPMLRFFAFAHLPFGLQGVSAWFADLALFLVESLPRNPERTVALRKLLEAKDCAVRAALP